MPEGTPEGETPVDKPDDVDREDIPEIKEPCDDPPPVVPINIQAIILNDDAVETPMNVPVVIEALENDEYIPSGEFSLLG